MADAAIVSAVINKAVEMGANMMMKESSRLSWLQADIEWLKLEMTLMQGYLENAEAKEDTNPILINLMKGIRDVVHDVEDILDIYLPQIESHRSSGLLKRMSTCFFPYYWTSNEFSREIGKIKRRVEGIDADRTRYGIVGDIPGTDAVSIVDLRTTKLHVDDPIIVGFEKDIKELKSKLEEHPFVSIVGMAGLGKTTLAKKVFKGIKDGFDCSASISISQNPNIKNLMQDIAKKVGLDKEKREENLEENLYSFLQGKRYVIFLDDIWANEAWDSLKGCFPIDSESVSRIIITSRNTGVGRYIGGENSLHKLHPFDDLTSWELFSGLIDIPSLELEMIGKQIVKKCGGVPLAIALIVGMLREREMTEFSWNGVLNTIGKSADDKCSQILGLSYRDLPTSLKSCFLYFGNFPEEYEFSASQVIRLWIAEKFIPGVGGDWEPEDVGAEYISQLESRNLIQVVKKGHDGRVKKFRVHQLLHRFCVNIGRDINFLETIDRSESSSAERVRGLSVPRNQSIAEKEKLIFQMTRLRALFHFGTDEKIEIKCLDNMLGRFKLLQVLKISFYFEDAHIFYQIGSLSRLNYLEISSRGPVEISSSIQNLKNLQTLDVQGCRHCPIKLPIEIWKMEQLRHLFLFFYGIDSSLQDQQVQVLLPNLQTLSRINCFDLKPTWLLEFTNLRKLELNSVTPEIMEVLCGPEPISKKLEVLSLRQWESHCSMNRRVSLAKYERLMKLSIMDGNMAMPQLPELPASLIKVKLGFTYLVKDPMKVLKNLPKLKILDLLGRIYRESKMDCSGADSFPQLEILKLYGLDNLEELIEGEEMGMPNLKQLITKECPKLERIPKRLQHLWMRS